MQFRGRIKGWEEDEAAGRVWGGFGTEASTGFPLVKS